MSISLTAYAVFMNGKRSVIAGIHEPRGAEYITSINCESVERFKKLFNQWFVDNKDKKIKRFELIHEGYGNANQFSFTSPSFKNVFECRDRDHLAYLAALHSNSSIQAWELR